MKWYNIGIWAFCIFGVISGIFDLHRNPDLSQGLGDANYYMCLVSTMMGAGISLWALINVIKAPMIKVKR